MVVAPADSQDDEGQHHATGDEERQLPEPARRIGDLVGGRHDEGGKGLKTRDRRRSRRRGAEPRQSGEVDGRVRTIDERVAQLLRCRHLRTEGGRAATAGRQQDAVVANQKSLFAGLPHDLAEQVGIIARPHAHDSDTELVARRATDGLREIEGPCPGPAILHDVAER